MKQLSTLIIASLLSITAFSQENSNDDNFISKGTFELTGGFSLSTTDYENTLSNIDGRSLSLSLFPEIGYAISDDLVLGTRVGLTYSENELSGGNNQISRFYSFAPYLKKYFSISDRFAIDIQGEVEYTITNNSEDSEGDIIAIGMRPGLNYRFNKSLGFSAQIGFLGYQSRNDENEFDESKSSRFNASLNASDFRVALTYFF